MSFIKFNQSSTLSDFFATIDSPALVITDLPAQLLREPLKLLATFAPEVGEDNSFSIVLNDTRLGVLCLGVPPAQPYPNLYTLNFYLTCKDVLISSDLF